MKIMGNKYNNKYDINLRGSPNLGYFLGAS